MIEILKRLYRKWQNVMKSTCMILLFIISSSMVIADLNYYDDFESHNTSVWNTTGTHFVIDGVTWSGQLWSNAGDGSNYGLIAQLEQYGFNFSGANFTIEYESVRSVGNSRPNINVLQNNVSALVAADDILHIIYSGGLIYAQERIGGSVNLNSTSALGTTGIGNYTYKQTQLGNGSVFMNFTYDSVTNVSYTVTYTTINDIQSIGFDHIGFRGLKNNDNEYNIEWINITIHEPQVVSPYTTDTSYYDFGFFDDFNRADNDTLDFDWIENVAVPNLVRIDNEQLVINDTSSSIPANAWHYLNEDNISKYVNNFSIDISITDLAVNSDELFIRFYDSLESGIIFYLEIDNRRLFFVGEQTTNVYNFSENITYNIKLKDFDYINNHVDVYINDSLEASNQNFSIDNEETSFIFIRSDTNERGLYYIDNFNVSYINCSPTWVCNGYGSCNTSDLKNCVSVNDTSNCGLPYSGDYSEFPAVGCDYCSPSWLCDGYGVCNSSDEQPCNSTQDQNNCFSQTGLLNDTYQGDYSEFPSQPCDFCTPSWFCINRTGCVINDTNPCNNVNDSNECYAQTNQSSDLFNGNFTQFLLGCDFCTPLFLCTNFSVCNQNSVQECNLLEDNNTPTCFNQTGLFNDSLDYADLNLDDYGQSCVFTGTINYTPMISLFFMFILWGFLLGFGFYTKNEVIVNITSVIGIFVAIYLINIDSVSNIIASLFGLFNGYILFIKK